MMWLNKFDVKEHRQTVQRFNLKYNFVNIFGMDNKYY